MTSRTAYLNRIATAVPPHDVHATFIRFARTLLAEERAQRVFDRMADKSGISSRYSVLEPTTEPENGTVDATGLYSRGRFAGTGARMRVFEAHAPWLAERAIERLELGSDIRSVTHLIATSCTGMYAPGLDWDIVKRCGLRADVERTAVLFMGCFAAVNALKLARHIVRSEPTARVLIVNLELCTLHLKETQSLEQLLSFLVFGDGCSAGIVSAEPEGMALQSFHSAMIPESSDLITWKVRDLGFDMFLSGQVPQSIRAGLAASSADILREAPKESITRWAVHPGGRTILDAVEHAFELDASALEASRAVLASHGNMSSATVMFVLQSILARAHRGERGCAMSFGPGLTAETFLFEKV